MNATARWITAAAGLLGLTGVALGAFGAHALKDQLAASGHGETWRTAVLYQLLHAIALLALAGLCRVPNEGSATGGRDAPVPASNATRASRPQSIAGIAGCWVAGVVLFSGSLYWLSLGGPKFLGPVTPLGGVALLAGWFMVARQAWKNPTP